MSATRPLVLQVPAWMHDELRARAHAEPPAALALKAFQVGFHRMFGPQASVAPADVPAPFKPKPLRFREPIEDLADAAPLPAPEPEPPPRAEPAGEVAAGGSDAPPVADRPRSRSPAAVGAGRNRHAQRERCDPQTLAVIDDSLARDPTPLEIRTARSLKNCGYGPVGISRQMGGLDLAIVERALRA